MKDLEQRAEKNHELDKEKSLLAAKVDKLEQDKESLISQISALERPAQQAQDKHVVVNQDQRRQSKDATCQTKSVEVRLSHIDCLLQKRGYNTYAKVSSSIKNFTCSIQNKPDETGMFICKVEITGGAQIMLFQDLLKFEGKGMNSVEAKEDAFKNFVGLMKNLSEK